MIPKRKIWDSVRAWVQTTTTFQTWTNMKFGIKNKNVNQNSTQRHRIPKATVQTNRMTMARRQVAIPRDHGYQALWGGDRKSWNTMSQTTETRQPIPSTNGCLPEKANTTNPTMRASTDSKIKLWAKATILKLKISRTKRALRSHFRWKRWRRQLSSRYHTQDTIKRQL